MTSGSLLRQLRGLARKGNDARASDGELLQRFAAHRDEAAFAGLVERHGPLVLGVAQRVLHHVHDAEDVFQAAFLVLARRAAALDKRRSITGWLYTVAYHLALRVQSNLARCRAVQTQVAKMPKVEHQTEEIWREVSPALDEELNRLPEKYRAVFLLCYVDGKTHAEAAAELGWPKGTVAGRLSRARELLRARLTRRGVTLSAGVLASVVSANAQVAPAPALAAAAIKAGVMFAAGKALATSAQVIKLANEGLHAMLWSKLRTTAIVLLAAVAAIAGGSLLAREALAAKEPAAQQPAAPKPDSAPARKPAGDVEKLQGVWRLVSETHATKSKPIVFESANLERQDGLRKLMITGNNLAAESKFRLEEKGSFKLDETAKPKVIDLTFGEKDALGTASLLGIYHVEGDTLSICYRIVPWDQPKERPRELRVEQGKYDVLLVFKREPQLRDSRSEEEKKRLARLRAGENLRKVGIGIHEYADANQRFPPPAIKGKDGTPLLSWRVAILPYLGHKELYDEFKLDQPWDSPHNKKLLRKMPAVYASTGDAPEEPGTTFYLAFVGVGTCFEEKETIFFQDVTDGTSNTLMIVEAAQPVPWTRPADLPYASDKPLPELGGMLNDGLFSFLMADGSPRFAAKRGANDELFQKLLRSIIVRNDGVALDLNELDP